MLQKIFDGRTDLVIDYINGGNSPFTSDELGRKLISYCAYYGDVTAIKFLLEKGADLKDLGKNYDLNGACFHGHWQLVQFLIENGADPNLPLETTNEYPLHSCIKPNHPATNYILEILLHAGADPTVKTIPQSKTGNFMRDVYCKGETPLHRAAAFGNEKSIKLLIKAGADISAKDINEESPIGWASWHCRPGSILALLTYDEHRIHPLHKERMLTDHGFGWSTGMEINLLGKTHLG